VVPGYIDALHIVARTDLVAFVPNRLIAALAKPLSLATILHRSIQASTNSSCSIRRQMIRARSGCAKSCWIGREMERNKRRTV
jgi:hypothetical protein